MAIEAGYNAVASWLWQVQVLVGHWPGLCVGRRRRVSFTLAREYVRHFHHEILRAIYLVTGIIGRDVI